MATGLAWQKKQAGADLQSQALTRIPCNPREFDDYVDSQTTHDPLSNLAKFPWHTYCINGASAAMHNNSIHMVRAPSTDFEPCFLTRVGWIKSMDLIDID